MTLRFFLFNIVRCPLTRCSRGLRGSRCLLTESTSRSRTSRAILSRLFYPQLDAYHGHQKPGANRCARQPTNLARILTRHQPPFFPLDRTSTEPAEPCSSCSSCSSNVLIPPIPPSRPPPPATRAKEPWPTATSPVRKLPPVLRHSFPALCPTTASAVRSRG